MTGGGGDRASDHCAEVREYLLHRSESRGQSTTELWERFFREQQLYVCRVAVHSGIPYAEAEDCVQQMWLELLTRLPDLEPSNDPEWLQHWLHKVIRSKLMDQRRKKRHRVAMSLQQCAEEALGYEIHFGMELEEMELKRCVHQALLILHRRVPQKTYRVVRMRFLRGLAVQQICSVLGLSRQQVWDRQRIGLKKLARILRELGYDAVLPDR